MERIARTGGLAGMAKEKEMREMKEKIYTIQQNSQRKDGEIKMLLNKIA